MREINTLYILVIVALAGTSVQTTSAQGIGTQCYPELGCFEMVYPWVSALRPFPPPLPPTEINVRLYCYTRASSERYNITLWPEISVKGCPFNSSRWTVFIIHGFASHGNSSWLSELKDNYLIQADANMFLVDWGQGAQLHNYLQVASNARIVAAEIVRFLKFLERKSGFMPAKLHLIGHSLGAQISSYTAKGTPGAGRITALDPAQPGFEGFDVKVRLDKGDANFVEVIHTNAAPFIPNLGLGMVRPYGHVDFYMNGGAKQPGCGLPAVSNIKSIGDLAKITAESLSTLVGCSHRVVTQYYIQVLKRDCVIWGRKTSLPKQFIDAVSLGKILPLFSNSQKCDAQSCLPLTLDTPRYPARGNFAATTSSKPPYCETNPEKIKKLFAEIKIDRSL